MYCNLNTGIIMTEGVGKRRNYDSIWGQLVEVIVRELDRVLVHIERCSSIYLWNKCVPGCTQMLSYSTSFSLYLWHTNQVVRMQIPVQI